MTKPDTEVQQPTPSSRAAMQSEGYKADGGQMRLRRPIRRVKDVISIVVFEFALKVSQL